MCSIPKLVSALFVETGGVYSNLPYVDLWDQTRDARKYAGPLPVVAHPPCQRWGKLWAGSPGYIAKTGIRKIKGDDSGCFLSALTSVRHFGGILEHPWGSQAWKFFGLAIPPRLGGWIQADKRGGWTCCIEQGRYGHYARKPTLLYSVGTSLPELRWGKSEPSFSQKDLERYGLKKCKKIGEVALKGGRKR